MCHCSRCHRDWHNCKNTLETHKWIDDQWGAGTSLTLELYSKRQPTIKGTDLDDIEYRIRLEKFYKLKTDALKEGRMTRDQAMSITWNDFYYNEFSSLWKQVIDWNWNDPFVQI